MTTTKAFLTDIDDAFETVHILPWLSVKDLGRYGCVSTAVQNMSAQMLRIEKRRRFLVSMYRRLTMYSLFGNAHTSILFGRRRDTWTRIRILKSTWWLSVMIDCDVDQTCRCIGCVNDDHTIAKYVTTDVHAILCTLAQLYMNYGGYTTFENVQVYPRQVVSPLSLAKGDVTYDEHIFIHDVLLSCDLPW
jgi:hypothetical protein